MKCQQNTLKKLAKFFSMISPRLRLRSRIGRITVNFETFLIVFLFLFYYSQTIRTLSRNIRLYTLTHIHTKKNMSDFYLSKNSRFLYLFCERILYSLLSFSLHVYIRTHAKITAFKKRRGKIYFIVHNYI
jgi:hypothetical protein